MSQTTPEPPPSAAAVAQPITLSEAARRLLRDGQPPGAYFQQLMENGLFRDAVQFSAHLLPKAEAVWWGCLCVWASARPNPAPTHVEALRATVRWLRQPSEENRRAAEAAGRAAGRDTPAGALALAAFWSGGSMSRPGLPEVAPAPHLTAKTVAGAVLMAATQGGPAAVEQRYRQFLALAADVDSGKNHWEPRPRH